MQVLGVDDTWGEKSHFSLAIFVIGSFPCPGGLPHVHVHPDSTNWIQWIKVNEEIKKATVMWQGSLKVNGSRSKRWVWSRYIMYIYEVFKE